MTSDKSYAVELRLNSVMTNMPTIVTAALQTAPSLTVPGQVEINHLHNDQTFTSVTAAGIGELAGITIPQAGTYRLEGRLTWVQGSAAAAQGFGFQGGFTSGSRLCIASFVENGAAGQTVFSDEVVNNSAANLPAFGSGDFVRTTISGLLVYTSSDTFGLTGWCGTSTSDQWTAKAGSSIDLVWAGY